MGAKGRICSRITFEGRLMRRLFRLLVDRWGGWDFAWGWGIHIIAFSDT